MKTKQIIIIALSVIWIRNVVANNHQRAPLYWSAYEYSFEASGNNMDGGAIPENIWKENIDWVARNLQPYGYNIICIDGWGDDFSYNENGYRTKHASGRGESGAVNWEHDYAWWSEYIQSKGMSLGIYNNPLWINRQAANCRIKGREDLTVGSLINENENSIWFTWVQVDRPGAEEYVKNYVQYYADIGVKYLRVDFLSWFEDGKDKLASLSSNINRPRSHYQTALRWIKEACNKNNMILSLVMPHLYNDAESEILSAPNSLIRINEDVCDGGWYRLSEINRGQSYSIWSKYHNMFDGFIYWSKLSDKMILDGDFTRLNTFANEDEKMTAISLQLIAGGPIAVADQYNSIGDNLRFYTNEELLQLNKENFIGKPLSNDPHNVNSQIWKGRLSNGDWIVGMFNRENQTTVRTFDLKKELGFSNGKVRDLWQFKNIGIKNSLNEEINPHGCKIFRISPTTTQISTYVENNIECISLHGNKVQIKGINDYELEIFNSQGQTIIHEKNLQNLSIIHLKDNDTFLIANIKNGEQEFRKKILLK